MRRFRRIISQILTLIGVFIAPTDTLQVDLLDSTSLESLEWTTYSNGGSGANRRGWREASYTDSEGDVFRVYTVCNVATDSVDNWLRTPFIRRGDANRLYVELKFSMRSCTKYPNPGRLHQCKESFKLLYYEADSDIANSMMPTWDDDTYRHIDVIAADQVFASASDIVINVETRSISLSSAGVYFAFHDHGACATLLSVRIYYVICPTTTLNYAFFLNATTGSELSSIIRVTGQCVDHAVKDQTVSYLCKADGNWYYLTGTCHCLPGFEPGRNSDSVNGNDVECTECSRHTYKWQTGSMACQPCPSYSEAAEPGSLDCSCIYGYYRSSTDSKAAPCTRPPSRVQNLTAVRVGQSSVNLSWHHPIDSGGRWDLQYRVECSNCGNRVVYAPSKSHPNSTRVYLSGLNSNTRYKITVYAENGVSQLSGVESTSDIVIITEPADATRITNVRIIVVGGDYISLAWDLPSNPDIDAYEVRSSKVSDQSENVTSVVVTTNNFTFFGLDHQTRYSFLVRGQTKKGWGEFSDVVYETTAHLSQLHQSDAQLGIIAGSFAGFVLCLAIIIILVVLFLRRNSRDCNRKVNCNQFQNAAATIPLFNAHAHGSFRTYVDPHTYEDPSEAVREFTKEIDVSCITIEAVIGGGEFGDVCRGRLRISPSDELMVAIKTLKTGSLDKNRLDFLTEASIIGQFDDPNVIYLEGVVTRTNPIMIVTEFMENGSLDRFLRLNDGCFTIFQLIGMIRGIASGMRHLSEMGYVHRDLAARNVLVNSSLICKVADFGLSREMETYESDGAYTVKGGKIPIRWTAPEAISYRKFTSASDVWSYGIVIWEVMSYGERPYWSWSNRDVINAIENNFRLPPPMDCPESVYELMLNCWQKDRSFRPKFAELVQSIDRLIRTPDLLRQMAMPRSGDFCESTQTEELTDVDFDVSVEEWLVNMKMDRYTEDFHRNGFTNLMKVANISLKDLVEMGISLVGYQKKIINEAQLLRSRLIGSFSGTTTNVNI